MSQESWVIIGTGLVILVFLGVCLDGIDKKLRTLIQIADRISKGGGQF